MNKICKNLNETEAFSKEIAKKITPGTLLCLYGEIGSGKTTFAKMLAKNLGIDQFKVKSPTYSYIRKYQLSTSPLFHIDLYRLENFDELLLQEILEITEQPQNITIIEWADRLQDHLPQKRMELHFQYRGENEREIKMQQL